MKMLPIKEDDESFLKIVTKDNSMANPSFRVYYGGNAVAVPFVWEATPGTPKHTKHSFSNEEINKDHLPPLTPPPSYYLKQPNKLPSNGSKKLSTTKIFQVLFPKRSMHTRQTSSISSSSSSTLSCPSSSTLIPDSTMRSSDEGQSRSRSRSLSLSLSLSRESKRSTFSGTGSSFDLMMMNNGHQEDDEQEEQVKSPRSVLCFGFGGSRRIRTCSVI